MEEQAPDEHTIAITILQSLYDTLGTIKMTRAEHEKIKQSVQVLVARLSKLNELEKQMEQDE